MDRILTFYTLLMMSHVMGLDSEDCDDAPVLCDCNELLVPFETVQVRFNAEKIGDEPASWNLTATVTWPPVESGTDTADLRYYVTFEPTVTQDDIADENCESLTSMTFGEEERIGCLSTVIPDTIVDEPTATFGDILFGYHYRLLLRVGINDSYSQRILHATDWVPPGEPNLPQRRGIFPMFAPDCLATTGDLEYCSEQPPPPLASVPRNVKIRVDSQSSVLDITWEEPHQVDGNVTYYEVFALKFEAGGWTERNAGVKIPPDEFRHSFELITEDIVPEMHRLSRGFIYAIRVTPFVVPDWPCITSDFRAREGGYYYELVDLRAEPTADPPAQQLTLPGTTEESQPEEDPPIMLYIIIAAVASLVVVSGLILLIIYRCSRRDREEQPEFEKRKSTHTTSPKLKAEPAIEFREKEILHLFDVVLGDAIGSGQFGEVFKARWQHNKGKRLRKHSEPRPEPTITVAVKTTKDNLSPARKEQFLDEIRLMVEIGNHDNILSLLGCRTIEEPYYLITEYMKYGSLKDFLLKSREPEIVIKHLIYDLNDFSKLQIVHQITKGMEYLSETKYFHGDLAARNILIGEGLSVKISDFGLSNDIYGTGYIRLPPENKRPVKWYSPEANLDGKCSTEGDVWSFGVVLYEIYSHGAEPYPDMQPREVIKRIDAGYRMEQPEECPDELYGLMLQCWQREPERRPTFFDLRESVENMIQKTRPDSYFEPEGDESYHIESEKETETPVYTNRRVKSRP